MSSVGRAVFRPVAQAPRPASGKNMPYMAAYMAMIIGLFVFPVTVVAVSIAYVKRRGSVGTVWCSHCRWLIRTFWWQVLGYTLTAIVYIAYAAVVGFIVGPISLVANPGILLGFGIWVWSIYRIAKGAIALSEQNGV